ncbi:MAG: 30S ribosomal protein S8 [Gemmatales bacterium]|nr:MAG: 30S ribosomal protein S8 [Gemmatales bacterium]
MMTDPVADMLTRIRNANRIERPAVDIPLSKLKTAIARVLKEEGFIIDYQIGTMTEGPASFQPDPDAKGANAYLRIFLKYGPEGERVIRHIQRVSRPGLRIYRSYEKLRPVLDGLGIAILSTSRGVMSDRQARKEKIGGEILCNVW